MSKTYVLNTKWPFIKRLVPETTEKAPAQEANPTQPPLAAPDLERVTLPDGRPGVIHHVKTDGNLGVRPIDANGRYLLNPNTTWKRADRVAIPEEYAFSREDLI